MNDAAGRDVATARTRSTSTTWPPRGRARSPARPRGRARAGRGAERGAAGAGNSLEHNSAARGRVAGPRGRAGRRGVGPRASRRPQHTAEDKLCLEDAAPKSPLDVNVCHGGAEDYSDKARCAVRPPQVQRWRCATLRWLARRASARGAQREPRRGAAGTQPMTLDLARESLRRRRRRRTCKARSSAQRQGGACTWPGAWPTSTRCRLAKPVPCQSRPSRPCRCPRGRSEPNRTGGTGLT